MVFFFEIFAFSLLRSLRSFHIPSYISFSPSLFYGFFFSSVHYPLNLPRSHLFFLFCCCLNWVRMASFSLLVFLIFRLDSLTSQFTISPARSLSSPTFLHRFVSAYHFSFCLPLCLNTSIRFLPSFQESASSPSLPECTRQFNTIWSIRFYSFEKSVNCGPCIMLATFVSLV